MTSDVVEKLKLAFKGIAADRKALVKVLSVILILLTAAVLKIHDAGRADITVEEVDKAEEIEQSEETVSSQDIIFVDIGGAVVSPGVYQVAKDTRLFEVIEMAGGLNENADADSVNRASFVEDGQKIIIPVKGSEQAAVSGSVQEPSSGDNPAAGLININTASRDELKTLTGIGDAIADRIIEYRSSNAFKSKEDIMSVKGIGESTYEKIKDRITC